MNRRNFLMTIGTGAAAVVVAAKAFAQTQGGNPLTAPTAPAKPNLLNVSTEIGSNHGHALVLTVETVVLALQQAHNAGSVKLDLQGKAGHPHSLVLSFNDLVNLLSLGVLQAQSSVDAGHSHPVKISILKVPQK